LQLRALIAAELTEIEQLARSRTEAARLVERARVIRLAHQGRTLTEITRRLKIREMIVGRLWKRFNAGEIGALADEPRSGRPPAYTSD
jgi:hypothetical protein